MVARKDQCYDNIPITKNAHDSTFCAANPKVNLENFPIKIQEKKTKSVSN